MCNNHFKEWLFNFLTPVCTNLVLVSEIKVVFSKSCPVVKINQVKSNYQDKGQCLSSSDTSEAAVLQLSNEDILQINEGG